MAKKWFGSVNESQDHRKSLKENQTKIETEQHFTIAQIKNTLVKTYIAQNIIEIKTKQKI